MAWHQQQGMPSVMIPSPRDRPGSHIYLPSVPSFMPHVIEIHCSKYVVSQGPFHKVWESHKATFYVEDNIDRNWVLMMLIHLQLMCFMYQVLLFDPIKVGQRFQVWVQPSQVLQPTSTRSQAGNLSRCSPEPSPQKVGLPCNLPGGVLGLLSVKGHLSS